MYSFYEIYLFYCTLLKHIIAQYNIVTLHFKAIQSLFYILISVRMKYYQKSKTIIIFSYIKWTPNIQVYRSRGRNLIDGNCPRRGTLPFFHSLFSSLYFNSNKIKNTNIKCQIHF